MHGACLWTWSQSDLLLLLLCLTSCVRAALQEKKHPGLVLLKSAERLDLLDDMQRMHATKTAELQVLCTWLYTGALLPPGTAPNCRARTAAAADRHEHAPAAKPEVQLGKVTAQRPSPFACAD